VVSRLPHSPAASWALKIAISRPCRPCGVATPRAIDRAWSHCSGNVAVPWHDISSSSDNGVLTTLPRHQNLRKRGCAAGMINSSPCAETRRRHGSLRMCHPQAAASPSSAAALEASEVRVQPHSNAQHWLAHVLTEDTPSYPSWRGRSRRSSCSTVFDHFGMAAFRPRAQYAAGSSRSSQQQSRCFCTSWSGAGFASCLWVAAEHCQRGMAAGAGYHWLTVDGPDAFAAFGLADGC